MTKRPAKNPPRTASRGHRSIVLPLIVDAEASQVMGGGVILDFNRHLVVECPSLDAAVSAVATVNGTEPENVRRGMQMQLQYLSAVRSGKKR